MNCFFLSASGEATKGWDDPDSGNGADGWGGAHALNGRCEHARAAPNLPKLPVDRSLALAAAFCPIKTKLQFFWWDCPGTVFTDKRSLLSQEPVRSR